MDIKQTSAEAFRRWRSNRKIRPFRPSEMSKHMAHVAKIHLRRAKKTGPDWIYHQTVRFIYDGYPHVAGPLFQSLKQLEGESKRVRGLRLILESEAKKPTPFGNLCPVKPGSAAARKRLLRQLNGN